MVNEEKVRIMTKIACFEKREGQEEIEESGCYKSDYIRSHVLKAVWSYTVAYFLILFLIFMYYLEYFLKYAIELDYKKIGLGILGVYLVIIVICVIISIMGYSVQYERKKNRLKQYYHELCELEHFYEETRKESTDDTSTGV